MNSHDLRLFRNAFVLGAWIWVWGCDFTAIYRKVFDKFSNSNKYKKTALGKLNDNDVFTFTFKKEETADLYGADPFFPERSSTSPLTFDKRFGQIKEFYRQGIVDTYPAWIASAARATCFGALPGMGSFISGGKDRLPYVPMEDKKIIEKDKDGKETVMWLRGHKRLYDFYESYMHVTEDHEGRGYGTFFPVR